MFMICSAQVHSLNLLYGTLLLKMPPLSLASLQKVAYLPRPAGGAVEKERQLVSPVTPHILFCMYDVHLCYLSRLHNFVSRYAQNPI